MFFQIMSASGLKQQYESLLEDMYEVGNKQILTSPMAMKLERVERLLELLGKPQEKFRSIHVGGTSGKGSTCTALSEYLQHAGYKTGLFLSPHIQIFNERIQINGLVIPTTVLETLWQKVRPLAIQVGEDMPTFGRPSFFEISVAICFEWFAQQKIDVAVIEVGLGGTLDATNVLPAEIAVITSIGLDHTEILGDTVELIAMDKAGIIKKGQQVWIGVPEKHLQQIFVDKCAQVGAELHILDHVAEEYDDELFYLRNIELAKAVVKTFDPDINQDIFSSDVVSRPPGRLEKMQDDPLVLLDGAHNPQKMQALVTAIQKDPLYSSVRWQIVMAIKEHKDSTEMIKIMAQLPIDSVIVTKFDVSGGFFTSQDPHALLQLIKAAGLKGEVIENPLDAIAIAVSNNQPTLVTGSLYLLELRLYWQPVETLLVQAEVGLKGTLN